MPSGQIRAMPLLSLLSLSCLYLLSVAAVPASGAGDAAMCLSDGALRAKTYWDSILGVWPVFVVSFVVAFLIGLPAVKESYKQSSRLYALCNQLIKALVSGSMTVGCILLLPLLQMDLSREAELGLAIFLGSWGAEVIQTLIVKRLGLHILDPMCQEDMDRLRERMASRNRERHAEQCPFKEDMKEDMKDSAGGGA